MKKIVLLLSVIFPIVLSAQSKSQFFESVEINIEEIKSNTRHSDFGPSLVGNELWFSAFTGEEIKKLQKGKTRGVYYNLYHTKLDNEGRIAQGRYGELEDISEGYHAGPVSWCEKTGELFVTLSNVKNPFLRNLVYQKMDINLKVIILKRVNGDWQLTEDLPFNNPKYSVGHPAISVSGDTLFFTSDKPGSGLGKTDIYMSVRNKGIWEDPINLGNNINSSNDEMFPTLFNNNTLIFSSKKGGGEEKDFDLYYSVFDKNGFGEPQIMDAFNSDEDDFHLSINKDLSIGYFTSRRLGGTGNDDIYMVEFTGDYKLELLVMDRIEQVPIQNPVVNFSDNITGELEGFILKRDLPKNSSVKATSALPNYMNDSKEFSTVNKPFGLISDTLWVEKVVVEQVFVLENIYYDFDKWDILPESEIELDNLIKIMNDNPGWTVELGSHTDSRGSDSYNEILSQKRSDSAVGYILSKGIQKERIVAKGYGESKLVNHCSNGVDCTDEEHRKNRRTEFKILSLENELIVESDHASLEKLIAASESENAKIKESDFAISTSARKSEITSKENTTNSLKESDSDKVYRVQLIATKRVLDIATQFADIQNLVDEYGITRNFIDGLNKYQLGNFTSAKEANEVKAQLRKLGYGNCFVSTIYKD